MGYLQIKRGLSENLPVEARPGELLFTTDTKKFYMNLDCPKDRGLTDFWRIEVEEWILLKKLPISAFED